MMKNLLLSITLIAAFAACQTTKPTKQCAMNGKKECPMKKGAACCATNH